MIISYNLQSIVVIIPYHHQAPCSSDPLSASAEDLQKWPAPSATAALDLDDTDVLCPTMGIHCSRVLEASVLPQAFSHTPRKRSHIKTCPLPRFKTGATTSVVLLLSALYILKHQPPSTHISVSPGSLPAAHCSWWNRPSAVEPGSWPSCPRFASTAALAPMQTFDGPSWVGFRCMRGPWRVWKEVDQLKRNTWKSIFNRL